QDALRRHGIPSVTQSQRSVFETQEAADLERSLLALAEPGDGRAVRAAISTEWVGADASELEALQATPDRLDPWLERLDTWGVQLKTFGVLAFVENLIHTANTRSRIMAQVDGERRLTNWMHLAELLQAQSGGGSASARALVRWVARMRRDAAARADQAGDDAIIRLESDARAVRIVTVHSSKGLQYGIVYCPFLWEGRSLGGREKAWPSFHDPERADQLSLDLGSDDLAKHLKQAEFEAFAESVRLLYVALTRARHQVAVAWGRIKEVESSPLAHLLHPLPPSEAGALVGPAWLKAMKTYCKSLEEADEALDLNRLAESSDGAIVLEHLPAHFETPRRPVETSVSNLAVARTAGRSVVQTRFVSSFSRLVAGGVVGGPGVFLQQLPEDHPASAGRDYDRAYDDPSWPQPSRVEEERAPVVLYDFPAGAGPGTLIHGVLERLDFQDPDSTALNRLCVEAVQRAGWDTALAAPLVSGLDQALRTPLGGPLGEFSLKDLPRLSRIDEMEFTLPVALDGTASLTPRRLAEALANYANTEGVQQYAARVANLAFGSLAGYLRGFIDLIFRHENRYYVVDYKSNRLGPFLEDYRAENLLKEMQRHDYILQYHLYSLALHRMLSIKMPGYTPREHFGGVYYLFLRGMSPQAGPSAGVYHDRPSEDVLAALSNVLGEGLGEPFGESGQ
ncbi:PD-(D/E)XK nuclease family protein, partial [Myxococcota bacterium]|nr:PD-(D/E)XK nuclease family protein [Myxococcota bacterium]